MGDINGIYINFNGEINFGLQVVWCVSKILKRIKLINQGLSECEYFLEYFAFFSKYFCETLLLTWGEHSLLGNEENGQGWLVYTGHKKQEITERNWGRQDARDISRNPAFLLDAVTLWGTPDYKCVDAELGLLINKFELTKSQKNKNLPQVININRKWYTVIANPSL